MYLRVYHSHIHQKKKRKKKKERDLHGMHSIVKSSSSSNPIPIAEGGSQDHQHSSLVKSPI